MQPKGVLELGQAIVEQLATNDRGDIVGSWMAHHLAELIELARTCEGEARQIAENRAVELILKLWGNRRNLPGSADPMSGYRDAIRVLVTMLPSGNPWRFVRGGNTKAQLLRDMFGSMSRLLMSGLLLTHEPEMRKISDVEWGALSEEERYLIQVLNTWHDFLVKPPSDDVDLESIFHILIVGSDEEEVDEDETSAAGETIAAAETTELDPPEVDHAAILSNVEIFHARLGELITQWREAPAKVDGQNAEFEDED